MLLGVVDRPLDVAEQLIGLGAVFIFAPQSQIGLAVADLKPRCLTMIDVGGDRDVALPSKAIGHVSNMGIDPKYLLNDDNDGTAVRIDRMGKISRDRLSQALHIDGAGLNLRSSRHSLVKGNGFPVLH